jgi:uncharacterized membrane protein YesL
MNWLRAYFTREGPGVPRNAAPKSGLPLLADVVRREWWMLIELNLLYVLFALPLVTLPAAQVAASRVTALMLADRPVYLVRDFWEAFRGRFWRATVLGALALLATGIAGYAAFVFVQMARLDILFVLPFVVSGATAVFATLAAIHGVTILAIADLPLGRVIRLALLGALARPLPALGALGVVALLWVLHILFYPASIFMPVVLNFSFGTLAVTFGVQGALTRLLAPDEGAAPAGIHAGGSAQLRVQ